MIEPTMDRARRTRRAAFALGLALCLAAPGAQAVEAAEIEHGFLRVGEQAFDLVVLRPTGFIALVVGSAFFTASAPVAAPYHAVKGSMEGVRGAYDVFVYPPYEYTILRPLGEF